MLISSIPANVIYSNSLKKKKENIIILYAKRDKPPKKRKKNMDNKICVNIKCYYDENKILFKKLFIKDASLSL